MGGDRERTECRKILEKKIREAFPDKEIRIVAKEEYPWEDPNKWRIRIVEPQELWRRIVLFLTEEFMTDKGILFNERVEEAIKLAKHKFALSQAGFLGYITLKTTGIEWQPAEEN